MQKSRVLITTGYTEGGLAAARNFAQRGYRVSTTVRQPSPLGWRSRYIDEDYVVPDMVGETDQSRFEGDLLRLIKQVRPCIFLPLTSRATFVASKFRETLRSFTNVNVPSLDAFLAAYDKGVCMAECRALRIPCPVQYSPEAARELLASGSDVTLVVKPDSDAGGSSGVKYVRRPERLDSALRECRVRFGGALIQEYVPGGPEAAKTAVLVFTPESQLIVAFTTQKKRQWPASGGATAIGISTADPRLVEQVLPFFQKWRWCGPAEVEFKTDSRTGEHKVIEINPRYPGYLRFLIDCGLDLPATFSSTAVPENRSIPFLAGSAGARYYNPALVFASFLGRLRSGPGRNGAHSKGDFQSSMKDLLQGLPAAARMLSDPWPLLAKALRPLWFGADRPSLLVERSNSFRYEG